MNAIHASDVDDQSNQALQNHPFGTGRPLKNENETGHRYAGAMIIDVHQ